MKYVLYILVTTLYSGNGEPIYTTTSSMAVIDSPYACENVKKRITKQLEENSNVKVTASCTPTSDTE